jgi:hypothetical protein
MKPPSSNRLSRPIPAKALDSLVALAVELAQWEVQISHRVQAKAERLAHDQLRRQELYKEFIEQASELYIHALQNGKPDVSALMRLYAEISRMRILSLPRVLNSVDQIVKNIIRAYLEPNKTFPELREMADSGLVDPLRNLARPAAQNPRVFITNRPTSVGRSRLESTASPSMAMVPRYPK